MNAASTRPARFRHGRLASPAGFGSTRRASTNTTNASSMKPT